MTNQPLVTIKDPYFALKLILWISIFCFISTTSSCKSQVQTFSFRHWLMQQLLSWTSKHGCESNEKNVPFRFYLFIYLFIIIIILPFISMHKCHVAPLETKFVLPCLKVEPLHVT
jgi:hypothetical protein